MSLLFLLVLSSTILPARSHETYQTKRLDKICSGGRKARFLLNSGAHLFKFNSSQTSTSEKFFSCHLELSLSSPDFGFFIFIEEMSFSGSTITGCGEDFLQFGRDILFVTTHLSVRYCGKVERPRLKTNLAVKEVSTSHISQRSYTEQSDREMDIWINMKLSPDKAGPHKNLALLVTPFKKKCGSDDVLYLQCGQEEACIRKDLQCDGMVNCPPSLGIVSDEHNCPNHPNSSGESTMLHLPSSLVIISAIAVVLVLLLISIITLLSYKKTKALHRNVQQTLERDSLSSECELPKPPSYNTVLRLGRSYQYCDV